MKLNAITNKLLTIALVIAIFGSGYKLGEYRKTQEINKQPLRKYTITNLNEAQERTLDFSLFWEAWNAIEQNYVDKATLNAQEMYYGAIRGMVESLGDPYTSFFTPEENQQSKDDLEGTFQGIGAELGMKDGMVVIIAPLKDSPAEKAGIKAGDAIIKVDGISTENWSLQKAVSEIRGQKGEKVVLTLLRKGKEFEISVVRDEIKVLHVELTYEGNVAVVELTRFGDNTNALWDQKVRDIVLRKQRGSLDGLVLDMRGNPGGYLDSAIYIAEEFLKEGDLIVKQEYADREPEIYESSRNGKLQDVPLVILIDEGSASASEIVAGSLKDHKKATLVGTNTFGKGTVQQPIDLSGGAGIHITISKWVMPHGGWIHEAGIKPDVKVENNIENGNTLTREKDKMLDKAIEILTNS